MTGDPHYARNGDVSLAYRVLGEGDFDLVFVTGFVGHVELITEHPTARRFFDRLASFARVIVYDKREQGLSDRTGKPPTLEQSMDDLRAVLDAVGADRPAMLGVSEGGPMCQLFAATYPERVRELVLYGTYARLVWADDYPIGIPLEALDRWKAEIGKHWGGQLTLELFAPSRVGDARFSEWWSRLLRNGSSPGGAVNLLDLYRELDTRQALGTIQAPTLVLHRTDDRLTPIEWGRFLAERIPDARFVELPGEDHLALSGDVEAVLDEIEEFLTGARQRPGPERVLATVVFGDIVDSTTRAAAMGDRRWRELLSDHDAIVRRELERFRGTLVKTMGDGFLATFDGPARAIEASAAIKKEAAGLGLELRLGVHTGEIETMNGDVGGLGVHIGARVASAAAPSEVLVSGTVKDLVVGSELRFEDRGARELKGVPGEWRLFALAA